VLFWLVPSELRSALELNLKTSHPLKNTNTKPIKLTQESFRVRRLEGFFKFLAVRPSLWRIGNGTSRLYFAMGALHLLGGTSWVKEVCFLGLFTH
jgi:hypothetical protein